LIGAIYLVETLMLGGLFSWQIQNNALSIKNGRATPKGYNSYKKMYELVQKPHRVRIRTIQFV
jgi:hypothetical protein